MNHPWTLFYFHPALIFCVTWSSLAVDDDNQHEVQHAAEAATSHHYSLLFFFSLGWRHDWRLMKQQSTLTMTMRHQRLLQLLYFFHLRVLWKDRDGGRICCNGFSFFFFIQRDKIKTVDHAWCSPFPMFHLTADGADLSPWGSQKPTWPLLFFIPRKGAFFAFFPSFSIPKHWEEEKGREEKQHMS